MAAAIKNQEIVMRQQRKSRLRLLVAVIAATSRTVVSQSRTDILVLAGMGHSGSSYGPGASNAVCSSKGDCCSGPGSRDQLNILPSKNLDIKPAADLDLEQIPSNLEHVILDVQGLTCTGCETKLFRSLHAIPGIFHLQTSLVLSQAEFDLNEKAGSIDEVIKSVEKATGFACQRINNEGQEVDVVVDGDAKVFVAQKYPHGVLQMTAIGHQLVRISYDGRIIGARVLLRECFDSPLKLGAPRRSSELESGKRHVWNMAWITLLSTILTIPVLVMAWAPLPHRPIAYGSASLALATIVQVVVAGPFYPSALRALLFTRVIEIDLLIVLSTSTAYIFSIVLFAYVVVGQPLSIEQFFETSTLLITLIVLGRLVSAFARQRAVESVSIRSLQEETATLCTTSGLNDEPIDVRLLQYGDCFKVQPDSRITTDGVVVSGTTEVDESMVTGESLPVEKYPGSPVIAGSLNGSGVIVVRLTHLPGDNTISTIATMVDQAKFSKPKTQEIVDVVAGYFVPVVLVLTIITFAIWVAIGVAVRHQRSGPAAVNAITYSLSVLIISCPCAIGLAVPMVVVIAGGVAAKHGVIFKSATTIEVARNISHVVFDKTGTLTQGRLAVMEELYLSEDQALAAAVTLGLTRDNKHPVSTALASCLNEKGVDAVSVEDTKSITGKGVQGTFRGVEVRCGNTRWLSANKRPEVQDLLVKGLTVVGVTMAEELVAIFGLCDSLRPESQFVVAELQKRNIGVSIVSGDDAGAVDAVAAKLDIPVSHVRSRCTPGDKQEYLKRLKADEGKKVLFCGDGTNDAVALAQADIGVHINTGSDVAQTAADVVLVRPYLSGVLILLDLSKAAFYRIFFNFAWAFVYNVFAVLLAAGAFVNARIEPQYAGLGELVSVLPVILIALQLKFFRRQY
ncbi:Cu2+-exporting ATPase [Cladophialophora psammophila CBS 110553]|uniref:Cu2+-exporting ATPase n=1 Tax=Cladophialophora psammophila CBS 110553 TaxID=1182543 RepID=W9X9E8_9EURO|nr:Cu2+-exporting ATPase [Cladophialophora psammophila CBS 110553]EXJ73561.1 Cu2+-exporting ATPase [Cladophialophora psammophila CBS 110553]